MESIFQLWKESPLLPYFIAFATGIFLFDTFEYLFPAPLLLLLFLYIAICLSIKFRTLCFYSSLAIIILTGYSVASLSNTKTPLLRPGHHVAQVISPIKKSAKATFATIEMYDQEQTNQWKSTNILAKAIILDSETTVTEGDIISFRSSFAPIDKHENIFSAQNIRNGIHQKTFIKSLKIVGHNHSSATKSIKIWFNTVFIRTSKHKDLINGLCFGDKCYFEKPTLDQFKKAGFMHLLAVSGMHIGALALIVKFLFGFLAQTSKNKVLTNIATIAIIWFYTALAGFSPSAVRASIMMAIYFVAESFEKRISNYQVLAASGIILLTLRPGDLYNAGFQLSFAAMFGIISFFRLYRSYIVGRMRNRIAFKILDLFAVGIGAQLGTLPLCLYYFGFYPSYSLLLGTIGGLAVLFLLAGILFSLILYATNMHLMGIEIIDWFAYIIKLLANIPSQLPYSTIECKMNCSQAGSMAFAIAIAFFIAEMKIRKREIAIFH